MQISLSSVRFSADSNEAIGCQLLIPLAFKNSGVSPMQRSRDRRYYSESTRGVPKGRECRSMASDAGVLVAALTPTKITYETVIPMNP